MSGFHGWRLAVVDYKIEPDANDRKCLRCKGNFTPYSMADSLQARPAVLGEGNQIVNRAVAVLPPTAYKCITCRSKESK